MIQSYIKHYKKYYLCYLNIFETQVLFLFIWKEYILFELVFISRNRDHGCATVQRYRKYCLVIFLCKQL